MKGRLRRVATVRFTQLLAHQTVTLNLFAFVGLSEEDRYNSNVYLTVRYALLAR